MPRGTTLSEYEKGQISALSAAGKCQTEIARHLGRSRHVVASFLRDPSAYNTTKRPGRPPMISPTTTRALFRQASQGRSSARELKDELNLPIGVRRVQRLLATNPNFKYTKRKACPKITERHRVNRVKWATEHVTWDRQKWNTVIFSDEKKFNLDGPDGLQYYWHDLRKEKQYYSTRQSGGGGLMVWGAFCHHGLTKLAYLKGNQDAEKYIDTLEEYLVPFLGDKYGRDCIFQQDGASCHTAHVTRQYLRDENITVMEWPSLSPDLNPIENIWGVLARAVYAHGRQFTTVEDLIVTSNLERFHLNVIYAAFHS
jgi:transposase